ncbi:hypothetical protein K438DRAFT_1995902 [Mycena galopus ATCC 62051]|nr:hypothetical protein K438DRAFT_1995902 [Mycena galopus ATCC 62051]
MSHSCISTLESSPCPSLCTVDIASKKFLQESDIVNRGGDMYIGQFGLEENFFLRTDDTVKQMQSVLTKAFSRIRGRPVCFVIDRHAEFMQTLQGTSGVDVLQAAWAALSKRMAIAELRFKRYDQEYRLQKNESMTYKSSHLTTSSPPTRSSPLMPAHHSTLQLIPQMCIPEPVRKSPNVLLRSVAADPPERFTSAIGPSVKTLVANIESALALEHGHKSLHPGGEQQHVPGGRLPSSTSPPPACSLTTVDKDVAVAVDSGGRGFKLAKAHVTLPCAESHTARNLFDESLMLCLGTSPCASAPGAPSSKSPAPAVVKNKAVELGGLEGMSGRNQQVADVLEGNARTKHDMGLTAVLLSEVLVPCPSLHSVFPSVVDLKLFVLVSTIMRTPLIPYLNWPSREDVTPCIAWAWEGIGTLLWI